MSWAHRERRIQELMDAEAVDRGELAAALEFIRKLNRRLGYTRDTVEIISADIPDGARNGHGPYAVLDVATGSADVPLALLEHARQNGQTIAVTALDLHAATLEEARQFTAGRVPLTRGHALCLPYGDATFDCVTSSLFLHHLPDDQAVAALAEMKRVARRRVVVADLIRSRQAYAWVCLFTLVSSRMVRHDARVSVRQAFTIDEIAGLAGRAGLRNIQVERRAGYRAVLIADVRH